jgi:hypothetical protein
VETKVACETLEPGPVGDAVADGPRAEHRARRGPVARRLARSRRDATHDITVYELERRQFACTRFCLDFLLFIFCETTGLYRAPRTHARGGSAGHRPPIQLRKDRDPCTSCQYQLNMESMPIWSMSFLRTPDSLSYFVDILH